VYQLPQEADRILRKGGLMDQSLTVRVIDGSTGEIFASAEVRLYPIGTPGEHCAVTGQDGCYWFDDLPDSEYSLAVYSPRHVAFYDHVTLLPGVTKVMTVQISPAGFLSGQILDERGEPPERCWFTLIREGERRGRSGYVDDSGDHDVSKDGTFCSPPLRAARYFLRFAGVLRKPAASGVSRELETPLDRCFDFLYPNANVLAGAEGFDVSAGETLSGLQLRIPRSLRHTIRGRVIGDLPGEPANTFVMFTREFGAIDGIGGGSGAPVQAEGSFEKEMHPGIYTAELTEFSAPDGEGRTHLIGRFGKVRLDLTQGNLYDVEIHVSSNGDG
jgi:Carboxypeptidase regulatory-like domain